MSAEDEGPLLDLLERWEALKNDGMEIAPKVICRCAGVPELAPQLQRRVRDLLALEGARVEVTRPHSTPPVECAGEPGQRGPGPQRYTRLRLHARGGLGEVHVAQDGELGREVALKELPPGRAQSPVHQARFLREAEITGGLEHPGIVPVYDLGRNPDGWPYYAMRFIRGEDLGVALRRFHATKFADASGRELQLRRLLRRFLDVCDAVAYAHSRGVIHRDLKPDNIMLGPFGETLVVDWGVAKVIGQPKPRSARASREWAGLRLGFWPERDRPDSAGRGDRNPELHESRAVGDGHAPLRRVPPGR
jgi:serine/threonine protein kinase